VIAGLGIVNVKEVEDLVSKIAILNAQEGFPSQDVSQLYSYAWFYRRKGSVVLHYLVRENKCFTDASKCEIGFALTKKVLAFVTVNVYQYPGVTSKIYFGKVEHPDYGYDLSFTQEGTSSASLMTIVDKIFVRLSAPDVHRFVHMSFIITPLKEVPEQL